MQKIKQIYRANYTGEDVVTNLTYEHGEWTPETESIPNSVFNTHTTTQAVAIANGPTREELNLIHIADHKGGLLGVDKLQSYGCNTLYKDFTPDFLVAVGDENVKELAESNYSDDNIVYVNGEHLINYPGKFYLIPQNLSYDAGSLAAYLACFDGHKKVFLLGYDSYTEFNDHRTQAFFIKALLEVMKTYNDVEFVRVMPTENYSVAPELISLPNFRQINYRDFVIEADLG
jgi:hypothetical protein